MNVKPLPGEDLQAIVDTVDWEPLRGARILLTGGTGFLGRWLVESFVLANQQHALDARLRSISRTAGLPHNDRAIDHTRIGILGEASPLIYGPRTHVIHAACPSCAVPPVDDITMWRTIVNGTDNVLNWCVGVEAKRVLYVSSGAAEHRTESVYGGAKKAAEMLCGIYAREYGMEIPIARPYALVGPGLPLDGHFAIGSFIRDALAGGPVKVVNGQTVLRSYLYASDAAAQLWTLLLKGESCVPVDVGSASIRSIRSLAYLVAEVLDVPVYAPDMTNELPDGCTDSYIPSLGRAGDFKKVGLKDAILKTARWHGWEPK